MRLALELPAVLAAAAVISGASPVSADTLRSRLGDVAATMRLEAQLARLVDRDDAAGIRALGASLRKEDGDRLHAIARATGPRPTDPFVLSLGPCHYAGLYIRLIAIDLAEGKARAERRGALRFINGTDRDDMFSSHLATCERVRNVKLTTRKIGSSCFPTGRDCDKDPDQ